mmetsp:Transcript_14998/g.28519  ORF Transcript_14998/g.28519 Transcript_14998/m.28519 type:complete len:268 (-) Transcript_14998:363-1166(-)
MTSSSTPAIPSPSSSMTNLFLIMAIYASPSEAFVSPIHSPCDVCHDVGRPSLFSATKKIIQFSSPTTSQTTSSILSTTSSSSSLHLFGNIFGNNDAEDDQQNLQENELARFSHELSSEDAAHVKFDSLSIMISEWSKFFTDPDKNMGLTTPVVLVELKSDEDNTDTDDVTNFSGVQFLFQKGKTGGKSAYQDKDDEKNSEKNKKDREDAVKDGGVEVKVNQLSNGNLSVTAKRCEIEEGTVVKEMSEQTIVDSLRKVMVAWKKEQLV